MSDSLDPLPMNEVLYGNRQNTGINRTGVLFGNPISSYDLNSTQNGLINLLAQYLTKNMSSVASVDLEGWGASTLLNRNTKLYNIKATVADSDRGETYFIYCPNLEINLPIIKQDQYLRIYYRVITYTKEARTNYENTPGEPAAIRANQMYRYGYRKSSATVTQEEAVYNDIGNNQIDSEVSVRKGLQWTLGWETSTGLENYTVGPIVALYRYIAKENNTGIELLFNTTKNIGLNDSLTNVPTIYTKSITRDDIVLDGAYNIFMGALDTSVFRVQVVFDQTFDIGASKNLIVGIKNAPSFDLEYHLCDGNIIESSSVWDIHWEANKPYLMTCASGLLSYDDPRREHWRYIKIRNLQLATPDYSSSDRTQWQDGSYIQNAENVGSKALVLYSLYSSAPYWRPKKNITYQFGRSITISYSNGVQRKEFFGYDHFFDGSSWKTNIPAGTLIDMPVYKKSNRDTGIGYYREFFPGAVLCNGAWISRTIYSELAFVLGDRFGSGNTNNFVLPDYSDRYSKSVKGDISGTANKGRNSFTLTQSNIPKMDVTLGSTSTGETTATATFAGTSANISVGIDNKKLLQATAKNHYHLIGVAPYTTSVLEDGYASSVAAATGWVIDSTSGTSGSGGYYFVKYPDSATYLKPTNMGYSNISPSISYKGIAKKGTNPNGSTMAIASIEKSNSTSGTEVNYHSRWAISSLGVLNTTSNFDANRMDYGTTTSNVTSYTPKGSITVKKHSHTLPSMKVGTTGSSATAVALNPSYYEVNTYIFLGQSLVMPDETVERRIDSQGNVYTTPSLSAEYYANIADNSSNL